MIEKCVLIDVIGAENQRWASNVGWKSRLFGKAKKRMGGKKGG